MKIQYDFFGFERLGRMHENKTFFLRKPGILILDLYLYSIKIQTNIDQNAVKNIQENHKFFEKKFRIFFGLDPARPTWLGWT
jgi:hypothetical protein